MWFNLSSLYNKSGSSSKVVNIELKAHNPSKESFRKDLEKLQLLGHASINTTSIYIDTNPKMLGDISKNLKI